MIESPQKPVPAPWAKSLAGQGYSTRPGQSGRNERGDSQFQCDRALGLEQGFFSRFSLDMRPL